MRISKLHLRDFGPFTNYKINFVDEESVCLLLTGKNNEGKTSIINALKLLNAATKVIYKKKQEIIVDKGMYYKLLQQDTENLLIGRMIYNYEDKIAEIQGCFTNGLEIDVYINPFKNIIYADCNGPIPPDVQQIIGFIPPLGPLSEDEDIIAKIPYLNACLNTSLAPRHLRNHFYQLLSRNEFALVQKIVNTSWENIELLDYDVDLARNRIYCYYKEGRIEREISWAGQGLQIWFQIITHLVRLRSSSILILDEPEINLHPEKQNDLIRILKEHYNGSIIIATHSIELMNNVSVSHIINVQKKQNQPQIKSTKERAYLELVRSQVGSNFNLIASQYEDFDIIIFTEDTSDFVVLRQLAEVFKIKNRAFNIPIHGFSEYKKTILYKEAYELLIGKKIKYSLLLDRDYYPEEYLLKIKKELEKNEIRTIYTIGKEIENLFLFPAMIKTIIPKHLHGEFNEFWEQVFKKERLECYSTYLTLHRQFLESKLDIKSITKKYTPYFDKGWDHPVNRFRLIAGKTALAKLRKFYRDEIGENLTLSTLIQKLVSIDNGDIKRFVEEIYHIK